MVVFLPWFWTSLVENKKEPESVFSFVSDFNFLLFMIIRKTNSFSLLLLFREILFSTIFFSLWSSEKPIRFCYCVYSAKFCFPAFSSIFFQFTLFKFDEVLIIRLRQKNKLASFLYLSWFSLYFHIPVLKMTLSRNTLIGIEIMSEARMILSHYSHSYWNLYIKKENNRQHLQL